VRDGICSSFLRICIEGDLSGAASSVQIFFYTMYLWLLVRKELVESLPQRFRVLIKYILLLFIPLITILNEVASFIGLHRRTFLSFECVFECVFDSQQDRIVATSSLVLLPQLLQTLGTSLQLSRWLSSRPFKLLHSVSLCTVSSWGWSTSAISRPRNRLRPHISAMVLDGSPQGSSSER
jgi:hypothetical protein